MPALFYIALCMLTGYVLCSFCLPQLHGIGEKSYTGKNIRICRYIALLPAWYLVGTLCVTWYVYLSALLISVTNINTERPLTYANGCAFVFFLLIDALLFFRMKKKQKLSAAPSPANAPLTKPELLFFVLCGLFIIYLMFLTFFVRDGKVCVGFSVFSDFAPHLGMIRSFSYGNNFPTQYSHFAGEDIRYHFMFQFLAGNLEYLGLRIDYAFNIPSILSMFSVCCLLYVLAVKIIGKRSGGFLSILFFLFRCSPSFFRFLAELPQGTDIWKALTEQDAFISYTTHEDWGLWNLNVYCNQRHFAFSIAIMLFTLILFIPYLYQMYAKLRQLRHDEASTRNKLQHFSEIFLLSREAILPASPVLSVFMGILLGGIAFWNGAVLIACLLILFVLALASDHRLDYLITAAIAVLLSILQSALFVNGSAVSPSFYWGFLAENRTLWGAVEYILELWGLLFVLVITYCFIGRGVKRYLVIAFLSPLILAFTFSMTIDITVNHKYVMIAAFLLSIIAAAVIICIWQQRQLGNRLFACLLTVTMTITGIFDFTVLMRLNDNQVEYSLDDPAIAWIRDNSNSQDIFLTSNYSLHKVVLSGAMLYYGWPYYAWSAGYDTASREEQVRLMYEAESSKELSALVQKNEIRYIIVDREVRTNSGYTVREDIISQTYSAVYSEGDGDWMFTIYDTQKPAAPHTPAAYAAGAEENQ